MGPEHPLLVFSATGTKRAAGDQGFPIWSPEARAQKERPYIQFGDPTLMQPSPAWPEAVIDHGPWLSRSRGLLTRGGPISCRSFRGISFSFFTRRRSRRRPTAPTAPVRRTPMPVALYIGAPLEKFPIRVLTGLSLFRITRFSTVINGVNTCPRGLGRQKSGIWY